MSEQESLDTWDGLLTNYMKAENLEVEMNEEDVAVCINAKRTGDELELALQYKDKNFVFSLNKTNMVFLKEQAKINSPREVIGKKITLRKTLAMNPQTKKEVPTLRISKVE